MTVSKLRSFIRLARDLVASRGSPERATATLKSMVAEIFAGCNVFVINPEGSGERAFLSADYNMPVEWVRRMVNVYGRIALIEPDPSTTGGQKFFSVPFIWILLDFGGEASSALLVVPSVGGSLPEGEALSVAGEMKSFFEHAFESSAFVEYRSVLKEAVIYPQSLVEKEVLIRMLDMAVREPLNTIIGYSMLLLDGSVAGPLSGPQAGFVQDILDGGDGVLKHIEEFREKIISED